MESIKIVIVGEDATGKTSTLETYTTNEFPTGRVPAVLQNQDVSATVDGQQISLSLWDTAGAAEYDRLRPLSYPHADCFLILYDVTSPSSLRTVRTKWVPELRAHSPDVPIVLVGNKMDLPRVLTEDDGTDVASEIEAAAFLEYSARTQENLKEVFEECARIALEERKPKEEKKEEEEQRVLILGLDGSGKTTTLYTLKHGKSSETTQTLGFNVESIERSGTHMSVWDVGGLKAVRSLWRLYYETTRGLLYVVDSADTARIDEASEELRAVLADEQMAGVPVCVVANKHDVPGALPVIDVERALGLSELVDREWHVQGACAVSGEGLFDALDWIVAQLK